MSKSKQCDWCERFSNQTFWKDGWYGVNTDKHDDLDFCTRICLISWLKDTSDSTKSETNKGKGEPKGGKCYAK